MAEIPRQEPDFSGDEEVVSLVLSGLGDVADLCLEDVPPSFVRIRIADIDLCAGVRRFKLQRKSQFVAHVNQGRQEIRDQDGGAIGENAFRLGAFWIRSQNQSLAHIRWRVGSRLIATSIVARTLALAHRLAK